jgi:hypothetical protein
MEKWVYVYKNRSDNYDGTFSAFLKKLDSFAIPLTFTFFSASTPCDPLVDFLFFSPVAALVADLALLVSCGTAVTAIASAAAFFRKASSLEKLFNGT